MSLGSVLARSLDSRSVQRHTPKTPIMLEETQAGMRVEVHSEDWEVTTVSFQRSSHPDIVTAESWRPICDYLLVCERDEDTRVVLVELKRTLRPDSKPWEQLRRSLPLWRYLHSACAVESERGGAEPTVPVRYAAVYSAVGERLAKETVRFADRSREWEWRGITVREIVSTSVALSDLTGRPGE